MKTKFMNETTLQEELDALGVKGLNEDTMARIALGPALSEAGCKGKKADMADGEDDKCSECGESPCVCDDEEEGEDYEESKHDPIDGPFVTPVLFDRIMALPFENLTGDQVEQVIEELKTKKVPRNIEGIAERAEVVARRLMEVAAVVSRRAKAGKIGRKKSYTCPKGYRRDPDGPKAPARPRCIQSKKAVAGGAAELHKISREQKIWSRGGAGTKSKKKSKRLAGLRQPLNQNAAFAVELEHLLSENRAQVENVRHEILMRIDNVLELLDWEFDDAAVTEVFNEAVDPIAASFQAGRLDEDVMTADAFLSEIRPVMSLISKSLDRIERSDLGNA